MPRMDLRKGHFRVQYAAHENRHALAATQRIHAHAWAVACCLCLLGMALSPRASAVPLNAAGTVQLHGFVGQGAVFSPDNGYGGAASKRGWSFDYREAGLNLAVVLTPRLSLSAQVVSRKFGDLSDGAPQLDYLSLRWQAYAGANASIGLRLGRNKNTALWLHSAQDIPDSYPGVRLPLIYMSRPQDVSAFDGVAVDGSYFFPSGDMLLWQVYGGVRQDVDSRQAQAFMFHGSIPAQLGARHMLVARASWQPAAWPDSEFGVSLGRAGQQVTVTGFGGRGLRQNWDADLSNVFARFAFGARTVTTEYSTITVHVSPLGHVRVRNAYVEFSDRLTSRWQAWLRWNWLENDKPQQGFAGYTAGPSASHALTLALKYTLSPHWKAALQTSWIDGVDYLPTYPGLNRATLRDQWQLHMAELIYVF